MSGASFVAGSCFFDSVKLNSYQKIVVGFATVMSAAAVLAATALGLLWQLQLQVVALAE